MREVPAGIPVRCVKPFRGIVERFFVVRPHHSRLHRDSLVQFIEGNDFIHMCLHNQGDAAFRGTEPEVDR